MTKGGIYNRTPQATLKPCSDPADCTRDGLEGSVTAPLIVDPPGVNTLAVISDGTHTKSGNSRAQELTEL